MKGMTPTTHITVSCLVTAFTLQAGAGPNVQIAVATAGCLAAHFAFDLVPHGCIATPQTIFRKVLPTMLEVVPGPLILAFSIQQFGSPLLFLTAALFGILPDIVTTLYGWNKSMVSRVPLAEALHLFHRKVHWFEQEQPDGEYVCPYPNKNLLFIEACCLVCIVAVLFAQDGL